VRGGGVEGGGLAVDGEPGAAQRRDGVGERGGGQEQVDAGVVGDVGQAVGGRLGVDGHEGRAGLERAEQGDVGLRRALEEQRHPGAGPHAAVGEDVRELVGARVEVGVAGRPPLVLDRRRLGRLVGGALEHVLEPGLRQA
jgi:hypothetical protein